MPYKDKAVKKAYDAKRYLENLDFLRNYKISIGCVDCGYKDHHAGLEFDHIEKKTRNVSEFLSNTRESLMREIAKCEVVCGTCHNIRTFERKQNMVCGVG